jgi:radical SAM superfamily enzyme YgiQ (UPF0313 family)
MSEIAMNTHKASKVLLLRPPTNLPKTLPVGLLYLASYLKKKLGTNIDIDILDLRLKNNSDEKELYQNIDSKNADIVGITALSAEIDATLKLAKFIKKKFSHVRLVIGGPLASAEHDYLANLNLFDNIVVGEGEEALLSIAAGHPVVSRPVLSSADFNAVDLNYVVSPDYSLVNLTTYFNLETHEAFQANKEAVPIMTSRGCPFNCSFCLHMFGTKVRYRRIENVISEIEHLVSRYKIKEIQIEDDIFNIKKERVVKFFDLLNQKNIKLSIAFPNGLKYDFLDEEIIKLFKKNGVYRVPLGIESTSDRMMTVLRKKHNFNKLQSVIQLLRKYNILVHGFFITGLPGENLEDLKTTLDFINKSNLHTYRVSRYLPFKNTDLYDRLAYNINISEESMIRNANYYSTDINVSDIPLPVIEKVLSRNNLKFYSNPLRLYRIFVAINKKALMRNIGRIFIYILSGILRDKRNL